MPDLPVKIPRLIATSVVRGSQQGDSHGGVFLIDFQSREVTRQVDWNTVKIDFSGRGWDRGLRGIEFYQRFIYIAASDELFVFDKSFAIKKSFRNPYLKHCHEIQRKENLLFLTSTGYDSLLVFDLVREVFVWGLYISQDAEGWKGASFDPNAESGPPFENRLHINSVYVDDSGIYFSGLRTNALLHVDGKFRIDPVCSLPPGVHNCRLFQQGVIFNDTAADVVRYVGRNGSSRAFRIVEFEKSELLYGDVDDSKLARAGFGRGLCPVTDQIIAAGSSPSTVSLYDIRSGQRLAWVNLSMDIRNAIHGLEVWPW